MIIIKGSGTNECSGKEQAAGKMAGWKGREPNAQTQMVFAEERRGFEFILHIQGNH